MINKSTEYKEVRMKNLFKLLICCAVLCITFVFMNGCADGDVLRVKDKKGIRFEQMIQEVKDKKIFNTDR